MAHDEIVGARGAVTIDIVFSSMVFSAARLFEASGVAQWYSGARLMSQAQMMILVRQSEQSARVIWDDGIFFGMLVGEVLQGRQPEGRVRILLAVDFSGFDEDSPRIIN